MSTRRFLIPLALGAGLGLSALVALADQSGQAASESSVEAPPEFTEAVLKDPAIVSAGHEIWQDQCRHCHGRSAYPGKAPKLKPGKYTPDFVFERVTNGFRKMPPWKDVYTREERMSVVAYVLSDDFSP